MSLLLRSGLREHARHIWQVVLSIAGVALGVAIVVAVDLTSGSAETAFRQATSSIAGRTTHEIVGSGSRIPDSTYRELRVGLVQRDCAPVVEGMVVLTGQTRRAIRLLGVDVFAEGRLRPWFGFETALRDVDLSSFMTRPGAVLLSVAVARALGLAPGDRFAIEVSGQAHPAVLAGLLAPEDSWTRQGLENVAIADIATAQELLGRSGLDRIDLRLPDDERGRTALAAITSWLPDGLELRAAGDRAGGLHQLTRGFRINLQAFGLLTLLVGAFLIYNTMVFSVVRRRQLIGVLRSIGATRGQLVRMLVFEALTLAGLGIAFGIVLGIVLANALLGLVAQTINDLYLTVSVTNVAPSAGVLVKASLLGLTVGLAGTLMPALEATGLRPHEVLQRTSLEQRLFRLRPKVSVAGLVSIAIAALCLTSGSRSTIVSYAGLFAGLFGAALLVPTASSVLLLAAVRPLQRLFGAPGSLAARGARAGLSRTAVATAALMLAIATSLGIGVMIATFRSNVDEWLRTTLVADAYVSVPSPVSARTSVALDTGLVAALGDTPAADKLATYLWKDVETRFGPARLAAVSGGPWVRESYRVLAGNRESMTEAFTGDGAVCVSEPFAWRHEVGLGSTIELRTDRGWKPFRVVAVFRDYGSDRGSLLIGRKPFDKLWTDDSVTSMAITAAPGKAAALVSQLREAASGRQAVIVRSNRDLRAISLEIFDRTFAITGVLRLLCIVVAFLGVLSALLALQLERVAETGILRAIGAAPKQIVTLVLAQTGLLGLCAGLLAIPVGLGLAWVMVHVINRQSFGWTLTSTPVPFGLVAEAVLLAVAASLCAGVAPARKLSTIPPSLALREE